MSIFGIRGVHVPHHKHTEKLAAVRMPIPKTVVIPMSMHIGAPAKPIVNVGDTVGVGQLIAEAGGFISSLFTLPFPVLSKKLTPSPEATEAP